MVYPGSTDNLTDQAWQGFIDSADVNNAYTAIRDLRDKIGNEVFSVVTHGADTAAARPDAEVVIWVGTVEPTNATTNDLLLRSDQNTTYRYTGSAWTQLTDRGHRSNNANPHNVTAAQASAVPTANVEDGAATFSGDGATTTFTVSHGLGAAPTVALVQATSAGANGAKHVINKTSTGFDVVFAAAPASGTDNVTLDYHARL